MTTVLVALLAGLATVVQIAIVPSFAPWAAPAAVLPVALIAAWGVLRGAGEVLPALPAVAIPLGVTSEERIGWFVIAALPLLVALLYVTPREQRVRSMALAACVAGGGSVAFGLVLLIAGGRLRALPTEAAPILAAGCAAAVIAGIGVLLLWRWRAHAHGLFA